MYIMTPGEPTAARAAASPTPSPRHGGRRAVADAAVVTAPPLSSAARPHPPLGIPASRRRCQPHVAAAAHLVAPLPPVSPRPPLSPPDPAAADVYADETGVTPFLPSWRWGYRSRRHPVGRRGRPTPGDVVDASSCRRRSSVLPHSVSSWSLPHFAGRGWRCPLTWWSPPPEAAAVPVLLRRFQPSSPSAFPVVESTHAFTAAVPPALLLVPTLHIVKPHHAPWPPSVSHLWDFPFLTAATLHSPTSSPPVGDAAPPPSPNPIGKPSPPSAHFSCCCRRPSPVGAAACPGFQASPPSRHCRRC